MTVERLLPIVLLTLKRFEITFTRWLHDCMFFFDRVFLSSGKTMNACGTNGKIRRCAEGLDFKGQNVGYPWTLFNSDARRFGLFCQSEFGCSQPVLSPCIHRSYRKTWNANVYPHQSMPSSLTSLRRGVDILLTVTSRASVTCPSVSVSSRTSGCRPFTA